jgi:hypothetical protein
MTRRKVLFIAYHFPPRHHIASVRAKGLARYLPLYGYEAKILTAKLPGPTDPRFDIIQTEYPGDVTDLILKQIRGKKQGSQRDEVASRFSAIEKKSTFGRFLLRTVRSVVEYPDNQRFWYRRALSAAYRTIASGEYDAILSTSYPVTSHLVAASLVDRFELPWVADLRDLWTQSHLRPYGRIRNWAERRVELSTLRKAGVLVTVSKPLADQLSKLHRREVLTITNGFDPEEIRAGTLTRTFTITYTGRVHPVFQDPTPLFEAINSLLRRGIAQRQELCVRFYGRKEVWLEELIQHHGLHDIVLQHGAQDRASALARQQESQVLLLLDWTDEKEKGVYTGKVFEYLAARRPILTVGKAAGVLMDLGRQTKAGVYCRTASEIEEYLGEALSQFYATGQVTYGGKPDEVGKFSHLEMARKFAEALNTVVRDRTQGDRINVC